MGSLSEILKLTIMLKFTEKSGRYFEKMPDKLVTFHPFGRGVLGMWFADDSWLDFNMF